MENSVSHVTLQTRVHVPDDRFDWLVDKFKPKSEVQPWLEIVDIAGLVKGASQVPLQLLLAATDSSSRY